MFGPGFLVKSEWRANELERPRIGPDGTPVTEDGEAVVDTIPPEFGALPVIYGTVMSSLIALAFAVPLSIGSDIQKLVEVAPSRTCPKCGDPLIFDDLEENFFGFLEKMPA